MHGLLFYGSFSPLGAGFEVCLYSVSKAPDGGASGPEEERRAGKLGKLGYAAFYFMLLVSHALASRTPSNLWPEAMTSAPSLSTPRLGQDGNLRVDRGERPAQQTERCCPEAASHSQWSNDTS